MRFFGKLLVIKEQCPFILRWAGALCLLALALGNAKADPQLSLSNPTIFFTTVASNLLQEQLGVDITRVQIFPTNEYTPAIHRLLQVTANIYDATTTNFYPTVFRPYFTSDGTNVFISGYEQVDTNSPALAQHPVEITDAFATGTIGTNGHQNFYNIPWILGAKKGLPNFNQVSMEYIASLSRRLQFVRLALNDPSAYRVTPMYELGISNLLGVEFWNSYASNYPGSVLINVDCAVSATVTNSAGLSYSNAFTLTNSVQIDQWLRNNSQLSFTPAFVTATNLELILPDSVYHQNPPHFENFSGAAFDTTPDFSIPDLKFTIQSKIFCEMFDVGPPLRLIDYVQFDGPASYRDLTGETQTPDGASGTNGYWSTNLVSTPWGTMPLGAKNQIFVSLGAFPLPPTSNPNLQVEINGFNMWLLDPQVGDPGTNQAPIIPLSQLSQLFTWEVNDPLVHYTASDLVRNPRAPNPASAGLHLYSLGTVNSFYLPWAVSALPARTDNVYAGVKDPGVRSSDNWNFPTGQNLSFDWIGRVHRGTPWQTIYLKSPVADLAEWESFSGITNPVQAALTHPTNDWALAALWARWLNTNELTSLLSVNSSADAWAAKLDGLTALTNSSTIQYDPLPVSSNSTQTAIVVAGIQTARASLPGQFFRSVGDVLSTPELSLTSPWLNHTYDRSITDDAYEKIATQLLPLLRADSIGSTVVQSNQNVITFTGYDGHPYAIETSPDMVNWVSIQTNSPVNGTMAVTNSIDADQKYFRSVLIH